MSKVQKGIKVDSDLWDEARILAIRAKIKGGISGLIGQLLKGYVASKNAPDDDTLPQDKDDFSDESGAIL